MYMTYYITECWDIMIDLIEERIVKTWESEQTDGVEELVLILIYDGTTIIVSGCSMCNKYLMIMELLEYELIVMTLD